MEPCPEYKRSTIHDGLCQLSLTQGHRERRHTEADVISASPRSPTDDSAYVMEFGARIIRQKYCGIPVSHLAQCRRKPSHIR